MSFLRGSANYVWCTTGVLGKGATGAVFQGVSKHDGEPVAVKTFNQLSHMRPPEVQMREFEVLKKVKHENIVKLLAIEEEQEGKGKVIVMELCTGGSLFNILDDPENAYGLQEDEFLLVLKHLSAGMKHLRDNNLVHRDLKPGNIMKFIADDGRTIYKLTDFGAARELEEDQEFMSLYGTEEYLHPDMYERAVLRKTVGKMFSATVDLWSIGVTLYHVATGNLPFRPYGGRRNKETMHYITTKKASGVIAGTQTTENGAIEWSRELPPSCQLSAGLASLVMPLLGGLLEVDTHKMWTFDRFFTEVMHVLARKVVHVFYVNKMAPLRIYMQPSDTYRDFQCLVLQQTDIAPVSQVLLFRECHLVGITGEESSGTSFPDTEERIPVILFHRENNNVSLEDPPRSAADSTPAKFPSFPQHTAVESDAAVAKLTCSVGHVHRRRVERLCLAGALVGSSQRMLIGVISQVLKKVYTQSQHERNLTRCLGQRLQALMACQRANVVVLSTGGCEEACKRMRGAAEATADKQQEYGALNQQLSALIPAIHQLHTRYIQDQVLRGEWESATRDIPDVTTSPAKACTYVSKLRKSWEHLLRDKASRSLTYNDEQFHMLEKTKMQKVGGDLRQLLQECQVAVSQLAEALADWYKMAQAVFLQAEILDKDIGIYGDGQRAFNSSLDQLQEEYDQIICDLQEGDLEATFSPKVLNGEELRRNRGGGGGGGAKKKDLAKSFHSSLKELSSVQEEVWSILKENSELVNQFQKLTLTLMPGEVKGDSCNN